jgi:hypothetical protein
MDILAQLAEVEDAELQNLLSHAMRCVLQQNMVVTNTNRALKAKQIPEDQIQQTQQALFMHTEIAQIMTALVNKLLESQDQPPAPPAAKPKKKKLPV